MMMRIMCAADSAPSTVRTGGGTITYQGMIRGARHQCDTQKNNLETEENVCYQFGLRGSFKFPTSFLRTCVLRARSHALLFLTFFIFGTPLWHVPHCVLLQFATFHPPFLPSFLPQKKCPRVPLPHFPRPSIPSR